MENRTGGRWRLSRGRSVAKWVVSESREAGFAGEPATQPDIDYRFRNGTAGVGDLPCRVAFRQSMIGRAIARPGDWAFDELRLADDTPRVDYSGFWHVPTHVRRAAQCVLIADAEQTVRFEVATCGGVVVWVGDEEAVRFEPFQRNTRCTHEIDLPLSAGENLVTVHFEDLCERDTNWHFELRLVSDVTLGLDVPGDYPGDLDALRQTLEGLRLNKLFFGEEPVGLVFDPAPADDLTLDVGVVGGHGDKSAKAVATVRVGAGEVRCNALAAADAPPGCAAVEVRARVGGAWSARVLGATFLGGVRRGTGEAIDERRAATARALLDVPRGGVAKALLHLALDEDLDVARRLIDREIEAIEARKDCSDFDMVPLLWAWHAFAGRRLDAAVWHRVEDAILGYRYWVDEPGNDVMWFWSENHVLCFHTSQYLAGQNFPERRFVVSGRTGAEQQAVARERLRNWFASVDAHGFAEWNSAAYYPIDFIGLLALHKLAADADIRALAKRELDRLFVMIGLHTVNGVPAGSMGRAYEKELFAAASTELATYAHIAWGDGWVGAGVKSVPMFCLSDYVPPAATGEYARPRNGGAIAGAYTQGLDHLGQLILWKDGEGQLSTVNGHAPGARGHQQHVVDVQLAGNPRARFWVNRPGDHRPWGHLRPSYWAGNATLPNVAQVDNMAMLVFGPAAPGTADLPTFTHAFVPSEVCDEVIAEGAWVFARVGGGYVALFASGGLTVEASGLYAGSAWRCEAETSGWLVAVGSARTDDGFAAFCDGWRDDAPVFDEELGRLTVARGGRRLALSIDGPLTADGVALAFQQRQSAPVVARGGEALAAWG